MANGRSPRARAVLVALWTVVGCSGRHAASDGTSPGSGGGGSDSCVTSPYTLGATCPISLPPYGTRRITFFAPGSDPGFVNISLTGSTSFTLAVVFEADGTSWPCSDFTWGFDQSCAFYVTGGARYLLVLGEAEGRAGTTSLTIARSQSMGSAREPVPISTESLINGSVGARGASYFAFVPDVSAVHDIGVTGQFSQLTWDLYGDPEFLDTLVECATTSLQPDLDCRAWLTAGATYYLRVRELSGAGQDFQLSVGSGMANEGSPGSPVPIPIGGPSRPSTVDVFGHSFYTFTPSGSGLYLVEVDGHSVTLDGLTYSFPSDYGWTLFEDPGFTTSVIVECRDYRQVQNGAERCLASLTAGVPYYLRVDEQAGYPNRAFDLVVLSRTSDGGSNDGTVGAPVALPGAFTQIAAFGSSYYVFQAAGGANGSAYRIALAPQADAGSNLSWVLFDDPGFSHELARCDRASGLVVQSCLTPALVPSTSYYLRVDENDGMAQPFSLLLNGGFPPPTSSSADAPVSVPVGPSGVHVVQDNTLSTGFYTFVTSAPQTYRVEADLATGDLYGLVGWTLYDDAAYTHEVAHCFKTDAIKTLGTSCTVSLPGDSPMYLKVQLRGAQSGTPYSIVIGDNDLHLVVDQSP